MGRKINILIGLICFLGLINYSFKENRFRKAFRDANIQFHNQRADSIFCLSNDFIFSGNNKCEITLTVDQVLQIYWNGYLNGSGDDVDFEKLLKDLKSNKKSLINHIDFIENIK